MIRSALIVALGGAFGSAARYVVSRLIQTHAASAFPVGTCAVNIAGCLLIGFIGSLAGRAAGIGDGMKLFLTVGFCGGFTTFSTFCNEGLGLMRGGNTLLATVYMAASLLLGLLAVQGGMALANIIK